MFWAGGTGSAKALGQHWRGMFADHWEAPSAEVTEGRRWEDRSGGGWARAGGVDLTLSTVRSVAHGECPEGGTPHPRHRPGKDGLGESGGQARWAWEPLSLRAAGRNVGCSISV